MAQLYFNSFSICLLLRLERSQNASGAWAVTYGKCVWNRRGAWWTVHEVAMNDFDPNVWDMLPPRYSNLGFSIKLFFHCFFWCWRLCKSLISHIVVLALLRRLTFFHDKSKFRRGGRLDDFWGQSHATTLTIHVWYIYLHLF